MSATEQANAAAHNVARACLDERDAFRDWLYAPPVPKDAGKTNEIRLDKAQMRKDAAVEEYEATIRALVEETA